MQIKIAPWSYFWVADQKLGLTQSHWKVYYSTEINRSLGFKAGKRYHKSGKI